MNTNNHLITCDSESTTEPQGLLDFFALQHENELWNAEVLLYVDFLEKLAFQVSRKPKWLTAHLRRIYYCFHANLSEQLFAGIVDLLIVLNKRGTAISRRVITGTKSRLTSNQVQQLLNYLEDNNADVSRLVGNQHSLFTKGFFGINEMVRQVEEDSSDNYDPLAIALEHIEYSQLDEAKEVLEKAVLDHPNRLDFQHELLQLYRPTRDSIGFYRMFANLTKSGAAMCDEWDNLNNYFKGQNNNG